MTGDPESSDNGVSCEGTSVSIKAALREDLKNCRLSREQVAFELSVVSGRRVSLAQIDAWSADSKPHRIPIEIVPKWVEIMDSRRVLDVICEAAGLYVATEKDRDLADIARTQLEIEHHERRMAQLKGKICDGR